MAVSCTVFDYFISKSTKSMKSVPGTLKVIESNFVSKIAPF